VGFQKSEWSTGSAVIFTVNLKAVSREVWKPAREDQSWLSQTPAGVPFVPGVSRSSARGALSRHLRAPYTAGCSAGMHAPAPPFLSYSQQDQASFTADLGRLLQPATYIDLAQETFLAMAPATT
jgi:hypothetical protein